MSNEYKTIHEFDFNLICEYFSNVERQVPGSPEVTVRALGFIDGLTPQSRIADLGCGTGGQTMTLAQRAPGQVTGLALYPDFLQIFNRKARTLRSPHPVKRTDASTAPIRWTTCPSGRNLWILSGRKALSTTSVSSGD